jgi:hypothetical protein
MKSLLIDNQDTRNKGSRHWFAPARIVDQQQLNSQTNYRELSLIFPHVEQVHHFFSITVPQKLHSHICGCGPDDAAS